MSIPRRDPNFTVAQLQEVGARLMQSAQEYWEASHKAGVNGAVIWLSSQDGLVIFTRGEYRSQLMRNIEEMGPTIQFGHTSDE